MTIRTIVKLLPLALLLAAGSSGAHNPLDHPEWCEQDSRLVIVDEIDWTREDVEDRESVCPPGDGNRSCSGQFDDDWIRTNRVSGRHCDRFAIRYSDSDHPDHGTVIFIPSGPEAFLEPDDHHRVYRMATGIQGSCVRCEPLPTPRR